MSNIDETLPKMIIIPGEIWKRLKEAIEARTGMVRKQAGSQSPALAGEPSAAPPAQSAVGSKKGARKNWRQHAESLEAYVRAKPDSNAWSLDVADLPAELLRELSAGHADVLEGRIIAIFDALGGSANLDQLLIGLFRKFHLIQKRRFLQNKIWRMVRKGRLHKVPKVRGMFSLAPARMNNRLRPRK
jgi:hypothetical protein